MQGLGHSRDPRCAVIEGKAGGIVLALQPTGAQTELEATVRQQIDGGNFLGEQRGVAEVVVVNEAADPQPGRRLGGQHEGRRDGEPRPEMVRHEQRVIAQRFDVPRERHPLRLRPRPARAQAKSKRSQRQCSLRWIAPSPEAGRVDACCGRTNQFKALM